MTQVIMRATSTVTLAFVGLFATGACGGGGGEGGNPTQPPPPAAVASVTVTPGSASVVVGDTVRFTAVAYDAAGATLARSITWTSSNPLVASVSSSGLVTGSSAGGAVSITAMAEGKTGSATVTVQPPAPIATLEVTRSSATIALRQTLSLGVIARDSAGHVLGNRTVSWSSANTAIVSVSPGGTVTGAKEGSAAITVSAEGKSATATVNVIAFKAIASGYAETCAVSLAGKLYCAGTRTGALATLVAPALRFKQVVGSPRLHDVTCAISTADDLYCWGENASGELGVGDLANRTTPTPVSGGLKFKSVSMGSGIIGGTIFNGVPIPAEPANHTCGLTTANELYCWGDGRRGQFGTGASTTSLVPVRASPVRRYTEVTVGRMYTCGVGEDGTTYCWGDNEAGHVGNGSWNTTGVSSPAAVSGQSTFHALSGGGATCALDAAGAPWCWGDNGLLKLGMTTTETCFGGKPCGTVARKVNTDLRFSVLESSQYSTCALDTAGAVHCWGMNVDDKFGTTLSPPTCTTANSLAPCTAVPTRGPTGFTTLSAGPNTVCGIHTDGGAYCWGGNAFGQRGSEDQAKSAVPAIFALNPGTSQ